MIINKLSGNNFTWSNYKHFHIWTNFKVKAFKHFMTFSLNLLISFVDISLFLSHQINSAVCKYWWQNSDKIFCSRSKIFYSARKLVFNLFFSPQSQIIFYLIWQLLSAIQFNRNLWVSRSEGLWRRSTMLIRY